MPSQDQPNRFQILSLDGGGLRGIFAAAALAELEADFNIRIADHFDLIVGTSTGGLIALGLASGFSAQEIVDFYMEQRSVIFPSSTLWRMHRIRRPYSPAPLRAALVGLFGERTLADCSIRLAIPSFDQTSNGLHLFRTPHLPKLRRDHRTPLVDVGLATTAAPTFFPAHEINGLRLIDGGVWANNPTMVGVVEALASCEVPMEAVHVLNVSTTTEIGHRSRRYDDGSPLRWASAIVDVTLRGQSLGAVAHAGLLLGKDHVHRLDVLVPKGLHALDKVDAKDLIGKAAAASRHASPALTSFFAHTAPAYRNHATGGPHGHDA